jgi:hypothetical protein
MVLSWEVLMYDGHWMVGCSFVLMEFLQQWKLGGNNGIQ